VAVTASTTPIAQIVTRLFRLVIRIFLFLEYHTAWYTLPRNGCSVGVLARGFGIQRVPESVSEQVERQYDDY
jgi:hypothetical protein